jgi:hypothetical protein
MYYKCEVSINDILPRKSGNNYKVSVAVKNNGMCISVVVNKDAGKLVNRRDTTKFYHLIDDIKNGEQGIMLTDVIYASPVEFKRELLVEIERLSATRNNGDPENKLNFKTAYFENDIYSITVLNGLILKRMESRSLDFKFYSFSTQKKSKIM